MKAYAALLPMGLAGWLGHTAPTAVAETDRAELLPSADSAHWQALSPLADADGEPRCRCFPWCKILDPTAGEPDGEQVRAHLYEPSALA